MAVKIHNREEDGGGPRQGRVDNDLGGTLISGGGWNKGNDGGSPTYDRRVAGEGQQSGYR